MPPKSFFHDKVENLLTYNQSYHIWGHVQNLISVWLNDWVNKLSSLSSSLETKTSITLLNTFMQKQFIIYFTSLNNLVICVFIDWSSASHSGFWHLFQLLQKLLQNSIRTTGSESQSRIIERQNYRTWFLNVALPFSSTFFNFRYKPLS